MISCRVAVLVAAALGVSPEHDTHNATHKHGHEVEPVVHAPADSTKITTVASSAPVVSQANRTKLAAVHASASVIKKELQDTSVEAERKALHEIGIAYQNALQEQAWQHQNRSTSEHISNASKGSKRESATANTTKPLSDRQAMAWHAARQAPMAPMATVRITKPNPMNSAGVHAYPMVRSRTKAAQAVTYSVERRDVPHVVVAGNGLHVVDASTSKAQCECGFEGVCEPHAAMAFMSCLQSSCSDTNCQCEDHQYINACHQLSNACQGTKLQLTCFADRTDAVMLKAATGESEKEAMEKATAEKAAETEKAEKEKSTGKQEGTEKVSKVKVAEKEVKARVVKHKTVRWSSTPAPKAKHKATATTATTTKDPVVALYAQLEQQKEELCGLSLSHEAGFLNAAAHKDLLKRDIDANMQELEKRCKELPEMHCEKDFHEYSAPGGACGVEVDNEFTRHAFRQGGKQGGEQSAAEKKSGCAAAVPGMLTVVAIIATLQ